MKRGDMRERIKLYRIKPPKGPHHIFNPTKDDVEPIREVWTKREDNISPGRWAMVTQNVIIRLQFIINYRRDLPEDLAIEHQGQIYTVVGRSELGNKSKWLMLLAGRLGESENGDALYGIG